MHAIQIACLVNFVEYVAPQACFRVQTEFSLVTFNRSFNYIFR